ncbi:hypothetical protein ScPMuIL_012772 [Solemya velum]
MAGCLSVSEEVSRVLDWVGFSEEEIQWRRDVYRQWDTLSNISSDITHGPLWYTTGSRAEGVGVDMLESDTDFMFESRVQPSLIHSCGDWVYRPGVGTLFVDVSGVHPGYCRLIRMYNNTPEFVDATDPRVTAWLSTSTDYVCHGDTVVLRSDMTSPPGYSTHGPAQTLCTPGECDVDGVPCFQLPWPPSAREWKERHRPCNYPPREFIHRFSQRVAETSEVIAKLSVISGQQSGSISRSVRYIRDCLRSTHATQILSFLRQNTMSNTTSLLLIRSSEQLFKQTVGHEYSQLKQANFYYQLGKYREAIQILNVVSNMAGHRALKVCDFDFQYVISEYQKKTLAESNSLFTGVSTSVMFMLPEIHVTPSALKFEAFKPDFEVCTLKDEYLYKTRTIAIVDPDVLMYYLQYLCYTQTREQAHAQVAFDNIPTRGCWAVKQRNVLQRHTALNILGHCYKERGQFRQAANCFVKSIQVEPKCNIAGVHLAILLEIEVILCDFHKEQAWQRWLSAKKNNMSGMKEETLQILRQISRSDSKEEYEHGVRVLRDSNAYQIRSFRNWMEKRWLLEHKRWVRCFRKDMINVKVNTTNGLERIHRIFKEDFLKKMGFGGTLVSMLTVLVKNFCPESEKKYIQNNVKSMALFKPYAESLPDFLHNRPHTFIQHCLKRLTNAPLHTIEETPQGLCVKSGDSDEIYELQMRLQTPKCTCEDYKSSHWPCKHMLAVIVSMPEYRWDSLPKTYTSLPCFVLDMGLICDEAPTEDGSTQEQQEPSPPEGSEDDLCDENLFKVSLGLLKNVETGLYGPVSSETLRLAVIKLKELDALLSEQAPKQAGIPIRKRRTPYKTAKPYQPEKKSKKSKDDTATPTVDAETSELYERSPRLEEHIVKEGTDFQGFDLLSKTQTEDVSIVNPAGYVVCRSKSFTVTDHDLNELVHHRTYMNNEVLGMYLQIIIQDSSREDGFIDSLVMQSALRQKKLPSRFNNIQTLERVFCCVHENGSHWVLLVIYPKERKTLYLNSLGEGKLMLDSYKAATRAMMRSIMGNELGIGRWKCVTLPHSKQTDSVSCGLFVCRFVELLLQNEQPKLEVSQYDLADQRMRIAERLIEETDNKMLDEICTYCGHMYDAGDDNTPVEWRDCDGCGRWFHIACLNLAVHSPQPYMNAWLCSHCLNNKIAKEMADEGIIMIQSSQEKAKGTREDEEPC